MLEKEALRQARGDSDVSEAEAQLADRLDRLSAPMAENVLKRAIEIHQDDQFDEDRSVSFDEVAKIAAELGIDAGTVRRALLAELDTEEVDAESLFERLFVPKRINGGIVAEGDEEAVAGQIAEWMREVEGMYPVRQSDGSATWEPVRSSGKLATALATAGMESIETRQTNLSLGDQLIEFDIDTQKLKNLLVAWVSMGVSFGAFVGLMLVLNESFATGLIRFLIPFGIGSVLGLSTAVAHVKLAARGLKKQINRALNGIVSVTTFGRGRAKKDAKSSDDPSWTEIVEDIKQ